MKTKTTKIKKYIYNKIKNNTGNANTIATQEHRITAKNVQTTNQFFFSNVRRNARKKKSKKLTLSKS